VSIGYDTQGSLEALWPEKPRKYAPVA
jgi:hypothetical protein